MENGQRMFEVRPMTDVIELVASLPVPAAAWRVVGLPRDGFAQTLAQCTAGQLQAFAGITAETGAGRQFVSRARQCLEFLQVPLAGAAGARTAEGAVGYPSGAQGPQGGFQAPLTGIPLGLVGDGRHRMPVRVTP